MVGSAFQIGFVIQNMNNKMFGNITCPECGHVQKMQIPEKSCIPFYKCEGCAKMIQVKESCCVFCDYADKACPVGHKKEE